MKPQWLIDLSKNTDGKLSEVSSGIVRLDASQGEAEEGKPLRRRAILCRSGSWEGMFGPVEVTKEKLEAIASRYNRERSAPINEHDYAPALVDHDRCADLIKGRLDVSQEQLAVDPIKDSDGNEGWALIGQIRVDDEDAKKKVLKGVYAQISISFNEETFELYEVSFVAVEAARRSIVLSQGDNNVSLEQMQARLSGLQKKVKDSNKLRASLCQSAQGNLDTTNTELQAIKDQIAKTMASLKTSSLKATFISILKQGKMTKKELDELDLEELSNLPKSALKAVLSSYETRPVSTDFSQYGKSGQEPMDDKTLKNLSKSDMKSAMSQQAKGENSLKNVPEQEEPMNDGSGDEDGDESDMPDTPTFAEVEKVVEELGDLEGKIQKIGDLYKSLKETLEKLNKEDAVTEE